MPVVLDATVSGAAANSYIATVAEALTLLDASPYLAAFTALADDVSRTRLLVRAARVLDSLGFAGEASVTTQSMQHPRTDMPHPSGWTWDANKIAFAIPVAQAEIAGFLASRPTTELDPFGSDESQNIANVSAGPVAVTFRAGAPTVGRDFLARAIIPALTARGLMHDASTVRLVR